MYLFPSPSTLSPAPSTWSSRFLLSQCLCSLLPAAIMTIYPDLISHDEILPSICKIWETEDGLCLEVEGKMISRTKGNIDDWLIDRNASAEGPQDSGTKSTVITDVNTVMNYHLQKTNFLKEAYKRSTSKIT